MKFKLIMCATLGNSNYLNKNGITETETEIWAERPFGSSLNHLIKHHTIKLEFNDWDLDLVSVNFSDNSMNWTYLIIK